MKQTLAEFEHGLLISLSSPVTPTAHPKGRVKWLEEIVYKKKENEGEYFKTNFEKHTHTL